MSNDNTELNATSGGDKIDTRAHAEDDGTVVKTQAVIVAHGPEGERPSAASDVDPFPVFDADCYFLLVEIRDLLKEMSERLPRPRR